MNTQLLDTLSSRLQSAEDLLNMMFDIPGLYEEEDITSQETKVSVLQAQVNLASNCPF